MPLKKLFISSVQSELSEERQEVYEYINSDALLGKFFQPFLFEHLPATDSGLSQIIRKTFQNTLDLKTGVYSSLIGYLLEKEIIRTVPFDAAVCEKATMTI